MNPRTSKSGLILSVDFELHWGVHDHKSVAEYGPNILGARAVIPKMLAMFKSHEVACTWATVGLLFARDKKDLIAHIPAMTPPYHNSQLDPYAKLNSIGDGEKDDPYHYAPSLIELIQATPFQTIGTHTFGHMPCLEPGATLQSFKADLLAAKTIMGRQGITPKSIVFPRNQYSYDYLSECRSAGIPVFRGTEKSWPYRSVPGAGQNYLRRAARLADAYMALSGPNFADLRKDPATGMTDVPASRFFRPIRTGSAPLEALKLKRILGGMRDAARQGRNFHLWWHPHNFGRHQSESMAQLSAVVDQLDALRQTYGWNSLSMEEAAA